jgi:hypothetical protein
MRRATCLWLAGLFLAAVGGFFGGMRGKEKSLPVKDSVTRDELSGLAYEARMKGSALIIKTDQVEQLRQVFQSVEGHKVGIEPLLTTLTNEDLTAILEALHNIEDLEPILSIKILSATAVRVRTGVIRGPLNGGGKTYRLESREGKWTVEETSHWVT